MSKDDIIERLTQDAVNGIMGQTFDFDAEDGTASYRRKIAGPIREAIRAARIAERAACSYIAASTKVDGNDIIAAAIRERD